MCFSLPARTHIHWRFGVPEPLGFEPERASELPCLKGMHLRQASHREGRHLAVAEKTDVDRVRKFYFILFYLSRQAAVCEESFFF